MSTSLTGKIPVYQQYPHLYAYDTQTGNHLLKSGILYRRRYAEYPSRFVESASMFPQPIPQNPVIGIQHVEQRETKTQIGAPIPPLQPTDEQLNERKKQHDESLIRSQVQNILREELRKNPEQYKNKTANDLSEAFRIMLIEKLSKVNETIEKPKEISTKLPSYESYRNKWNFLLNNKQKEDDYDDNVDEYEEDFEETDI